jgi:hypothetical protein
MSLFSQSLHIGDGSNEFTYFMNDIIFIYSYFIARPHKYFHPVATDDFTETTGERESRCVGQTAGLLGSAFSEVESECELNGLVGEGNVSDSQPWWRSIFQPIHSLFRNPSSLVLTYINGRYKISNCKYLIARSYNISHCNYILILLRRV